MISNKLDRTTKLSTIIFFIILSGALFSLTDFHAKGYELSIYASTPIFFWIAVIFGLIYGILLIALAIYREKDEFARMGIFIIIFCNFVLLTLYALKGYYYLERADTLSYIGYAKDVSKYGVFFSYNFYPIVAILTSQLNQTTNLSIITISRYIPAVFNCFYIISYYCLSKTLNIDKKYRLFTLIASVPIFFAWFTPTILYMSLAVMTMPFLLYCLQKNSDIRFRFITIIVIIMHIFFHPITVVMLFVYFTVIYCVNIYSHNTKYNNVSLRLLILFFVMLLGWFTSQYMVLHSIAELILQLSGSLNTPSTAAQSMSFFYTLGLRESIKAFIIMTSDEIIYSISAIVSIYYIVKYKENVPNIISIALCFIIGNLFLAIIALTTNIHTPYRLINLNPNMILTPLLVGYLLYKFRNNKIKRTIIFLFITVSIITTVFSLYQSPITMLPTDHITNSEVTGTNWLLTYKNQTMPTADEKVPVFRFADLIYGYDYKFKHSSLTRDLEFPNHFGLNNSTNFPIDKNRYLVISDYVIEGYTKVWDKLHSFDIHDFEKIESCNNVDKIYDNENTQLFFVHKR